MSADAVLYDLPGPRARRRALIGTLIAGAALLALLVVVMRRFHERGQFSMELWGPLIDPTNESFEAVWRLIGKGLTATLIAAVLSILFSLIVGTALGSARMLLGRGARLPLVGLIELFRGLPVVVTMFYVYTVMQSLDVDLGFLPGDAGLWYVVIALTLYNSVIIAEILRSGVASLPSGQREAGLAVGMSPRQVMTTVQLPQAFRTMLPALISQLVVVLKDTSLAALLGFYIELLRRGNIIAQNLDNPIQTLFVVALIYVLINYALSRLAVTVERRLARRGVPRRQMDPGTEVPGLTLV